MKPTLTYGLGIAGANILLGFILFFLGYHNDAAKFSASQWIGSTAGTVILIVGLVLGLRAVRETTPDGSLSYGRGVGSGAMIGLIAGVVGAVFSLLYGFVINPEFHEVLYQVQVNQMEAKGASNQQIEGAAGMLRFFTGAVWMAIAQAVFAPLMATLFALIIAIFVKRGPTAAPAPAL